MKGSTHIAAGTAAGAIIAVSQGLGFVSMLEVTACTVVGALIPDIDIGTSKIGRHLPVTSFIIQALIGHRTMFHAPLFYGLVFSYLLFTWPQYGIEITALFVGVASHLLLDMLNPAGIPIFWPCKKRFRLANIRTGSILDAGIAFVCYVLALINLISLI